MRWFVKSRLGLLSLIAGCSGQALTPSTPPRDERLASSATEPAPEKSAKPFHAPASLALDHFWVLGPFPKLESESAARESLDHDYLTTLGGEAEARIDANTKVRYGDVEFSSVRVPYQASGVDFVEQWASESDAASAIPKTNDKVAYAYGEVEVDTAQQGSALFGSDDGAVVWVNGQRVHHIVANRPLTLADDEFAVPLVAGKNRILVKVDNGYGGWAFGISLFDSDGTRQNRAIAARRELDFAPHPAPDHYVLQDEFPRIVVGDEDAFRRAFGTEKLSVRWFGPDLEAATRPSLPGRYIAFLEATTRDGYRYRRMLTFAKVPPYTTPWFSAPPYRELPELPFPVSSEVPKEARAELSRLIWAGGVGSLWEGESSAIAAAAFYDLKSGALSKSSALPDDEPAWLKGGFVRNLEHQLELRMKLEKRAKKQLAPPAPLPNKAPELRAGNELQAGMKPGSVARLRAVAAEWAKADPHGFVVLVARRGVVFMHEGFNGFAKDTGFYPASIAKTMGGLLFARAVDQKLIRFDDRLASVFPSWDAQATKNVTFRHCFYHAVGFSGHFSRGGLQNPFLDQSLLIQDGIFLEHGKRFVYAGDDINLTGMALELLTGKSVVRLLYENLQRPFDEPVNQFDLGAGASFTSMYLAKVGQMLMQDGAYGAYRFFSPGFVRELWPKRIADYAPGFEDKKLESGIGLGWMIDPPGAPREKGALGPNVVGHGAASGVLWRVVPDHDLVVVVGRDAFASASDNETWGTRFVQAVAANLAE